MIGTVQVSLANGHRWVRGLHPLLALVVLTLAATLALRATDDTATTNLDWKEHEREYREEHQAGR